MADTRPEGTDHIVTGNADMSTAGSDAPNAAFHTDDVKAGARSQADEFTGRMGDKARDYAEQGKDRATGALDDVARLIGDNAAQLDELLGAKYGDYARRASDYVSGASDALRDKDVDELLDDARDLVRRAPAVAISAGAAVGFALARVIKAGSGELDAAARNPRGSKSTRDPDASV